MADNYAGTITQNPGATLTVTNWMISGGSFVGGNSTISVTQYLNMNGGTFTSTSGSLTISFGANLLAGSTFNGTAGNITIIGNSSFLGTFKASSGATLFRNNTVIFGATTAFDANGGTVEFRRTSAGTSYLWNPGSVVTFNNVIYSTTASAAHIHIYQGTLPMTGNLTINNTDPLGSATANTLAGLNTEVGGNLTVEGHGLVGTGLIKIKGLGANIIATAATTANLPAIELSTANATITLSGNPILNGDLTCGPFGMTLNGAFTAKRSVSLACGLAGTAAVTFMGSGSHRFDTYGGSFVSGNVVVNKSGGTLTLDATTTTLTSPGQALTIQAGTVNMNGKALTVNGALTIQSGATLTRGGGTLTYGSLSNSGTLNP